MINRQALIKKHNPVHTTINTDAPLTVGNGDFAFTADVTGMQTFYDLYASHHMPLCTMSQKLFHTTPADNEKKYYTLDDVQMTPYAYENRTIELPINKYEDSADAYMWLRQNPHRPNLARIALTVNGRVPEPSRISEIHQELHLLTGELVSKFNIDNILCTVRTCCHSEGDILGFRIDTNHPGIGVLIGFPYGHHDITGSDWHASDAHKTLLLTEAFNACNKLTFSRKMDDLNPFISVKGSHKLDATKMQDHIYLITTQSTSWSFTLSFNQQHAAGHTHFEEVVKASHAHWEKFWHTTGIIDFTGSTAPQAFELERRLILSTYLLAIQSSGTLPPQETGLTCNSWHGKFHLEMHFWHSAWLPLYNQPEQLKKSLPWYQSILPKAKEEARKNGFKGARWPKQVANDGNQSPSPIAPLLLWQQSHLVYMLELIYQVEQDKELLENYWEVLKETIEFMCDYFTYEEKTDCYVLSAPIIPAQEEHEPTVVKNPTFELAYWRLCLSIGVLWANRLGKPSEVWSAIHEKIAALPVIDGLYPAHANCPDTFETFNRDHPSMLGALGVLPGADVDEAVMKATLHKVLASWDFESMWGWDFAVMAMTATRLEMPELAMDILLMDTPKNVYVESGNNYQRTRIDLPLYLPGNGSLLFAMALMVAGYKGCDTPLPGIPKDGSWQVAYENVHGFEY